MVPPLGPRDDLVAVLLTNNGAPYGRIVMEIRGDVVPKTAANFISLCKGDGKLKYSYQGTPFHRIIPSPLPSFIQGGDVVNKKGTGNANAEGALFADENFTLKHDTAGVLSMANAGPNTNGSQFIITTSAAKTLDNKQVVFGKVIEGLYLITQISTSMGTTITGKPTRTILISSCGVV